MTKIKICGLRRPEDIAAVNQYRPDYVGFVFAPGKRQVTPIQAAALVQNLSPAICPVGVFVNAPEEMICGLVEAGTIRVVQFHGQETEEAIVRMKRRFPDVPVIRAVSMKEIMNCAGGMKVRRIIFCWMPGAEAPDIPLTTV